MHKSNTTFRHRFHGDQNMVFGEGTSVVNILYGDVVHALAMYTCRKS